MPHTNATLEALATRYTELGAFISLHTGNPGATGASEATGGSYARKQTTWTLGASDGVATGSQVTFNVPAGTYAFAGIWTAATGGTFIGYVPITSTTLGAPGDILVTPTITVT